MTREEFLVASRRVRIYGSLCFCFFVPLAVSMAVFLNEKVQLIPMESGWFLFALGLTGEGIIILLLPLLAALCVEKRFGLHCLSCGRSITCRCRRDILLRTGRCCHCNELLFRVD
jgi:hypothetical protein